MAASAESAQSAARDYPAGAVIVAGGSGGLGSAICHALSGSGVPLVIGYAARPDAARTLSHALSRPEAPAIAARIDLTDEASIGTAVAEAERIAGGLAGAMFAAGSRKCFDFVSQVSDEQWEQALLLDVRGFLSFARATLPALRKNGGSIVALTTYQAGRIEVRGSLSSVAKAAVERAVMAIAREEGRYGVRANAIRAGWIDAGSGGALLDEATRQRKARDIPLGRVGRAEEIARVAAFLLSNAASFITGAAIPVDGGESL